MASALVVKTFQGASVVSRKLVAGALAFVSARPVTFFCGVGKFPDPHSNGQDVEDLRLVGSSAGGHRACCWGANAAGRTVV